MEEEVRFEDLPRLVKELAQEIRELRAELRAITTSVRQYPKSVTIEQASEIIGKIPGAIRQLVLRGKIKAFKAGSRHYFDREYLESCVRGEAKDQVPNIDRFKTRR